MRPNLITDQSARDGIERLLGDARNRGKQLSLVIGGEPLDVKHAAQFQPGSVTPAPSIVDGPVELILPWPPSVNNYWSSRVVLSRGDSLSKLRCPDCRGRIKGLVIPHLTKRAKEFRAAVDLVVGASLRRNESGIVSTLGRVAVEILVYQPDNRVRDLDNLCKAVLDSLTHAGLWGDDGQIDVLTIRREHVVRGGRIKVRVTEASR